MDGLAACQRSSETRQLSAPRSIAMRARSCMATSAVRRLSQECVGQPAVDGNHVPGGAACSRTRLKENRLGAIGRVDRLMRERALGIKLRQPAAQFFVAERLLKRYVVFL